MCVCVCVYERNDWLCQSCLCRAPLGSWSRWLLSSRSCPCCAAPPCPEWWWFSSSPKFSTKSKEKPARCYRNAVVGVVVVRSSRSRGGNKGGKTYSHFHLQLGKIDTLLRDRYVVEVSFLLREKFEPSGGRRFDELRYPERQGAHEVVPRRSIPIPDLDQESPVFVLGFQVAVKKSNRRVYIYLYTIPYWINRHAPR